LQVAAAQRFSSRHVERSQLTPDDAENLNSLFGGHFLAEDVRIFLRAVMTGEIATMGDVEDGREGFNRARPLEQPYIDRVPGILPQYGGKKVPVLLEVGGERLEPGCGSWIMRRSRQVSSSLAGSALQSPYGIIAELGCDLGYLSRINSHSCG